MARRLGRGEVWLHRFEQPDKRRPVVVLTRSSVIPFLESVLVAPITSTIRGLPSEVLLGLEHGMKGPCAVNLDNVRPVRKTDLEAYVATLPSPLMTSICTALQVAVGCDAPGWQAER